MASLYDVAARAGVSKTLVSRVLNSQKGVSPQSRERILDAMKELDYTPNALARSLVLQKTHIIGVVLNSLCEPYFFELIQGIQDAIKRSDYSVLFCSGDKSPHIKDQYIQFFSQGRADGVIIYGCEKHDRELIKKLSRSNFPFVIVENEVEGCNNIVVDSIFGSRLAVDYLVEKGCKSIYHVTGDMEVEAAIDRHDGYIKAMQKHGLAVSSDTILPSDFTVDSGYQSMRTFLNQEKKCPDAFYFGSDNTAFGGMIALQEAGIRIPQDVQIIGFDNDVPRNIDVSLKKLTTLSQPLHQIGSSAVDTLIASIENRTSAPQRVTFYPELVIRDTTR